MDFDDSETPPPMLFDPAREIDPRAREWAQREVEYVTQISQLKQEVRSLRVKLGKLALKINESRRVPTTAKKEVK